MQFQQVVMPLLPFCDLRPVFSAANEAKLANTVGIVLSTRHVAGSDIGQSMHCRSFVAQITDRKFTSTSGPQDAGSLVREQAVDLETVSEQGVLKCVCHKNGGNYLPNSEEVMHCG